MTLRSLFPERRERQKTPLWIVLLPICLGVLVAMMRPRLAALGAPDLRDATPMSARTTSTDSDSLPVRAISSDASTTVTPRPASIRPSRAASSQRAPAARDSRSDASANAAPAAQPEPRLANPATDDPSRWRTTTALADDARAALRSGRNTEAFGIAAACLRRDPADPRCLQTAALATMRDGRFDDARSYVDACMQNEPDDPRCLSLSAQLALHDRDLTLAGILSWRLSQLAPDDVDTFMARAQLAEMQGDSAAAERSYRRACQAGQSDACLRLGEIMSTTVQ